MRAGLALALLLGLSGAGGARVIEIERACFEGFCVESREAFTVIAREPARGRYRLRFSREQAVLYLQSGAPPEHPHCGTMCTERVEAGERRQYHSHTGRLLGRVIGPLEGCAGAPSFHLYAYVYFSGADPAALSVERKCPP